MNKKTTDRTKTTPEIHQQITIQAAQSGMTITNYIKMIVENDKKRMIKIKRNLDGTSKK